MKKRLLIFAILCYTVNAFLGIPSVSRLPMLRMHNENEPIFLRNPHVNKIVSNESSNILRIYTTYNHKYSIIVYKCGKIDQYFNQTLKLKCNQDIIQLNIVSMNYFRKLYDDLCILRNKV